MTLLLGGWRVGDTGTGIQHTGSLVQLDGVRYKVQYITSKGMLDLKSDGGDVQYGVDPSNVSVVPAASDSEPQAAPPSYGGGFGNNSLLGMGITIWDGGHGHAATVVEVDSVSGKNLLRVRFDSAVGKADEWIERHRLKQSQRVSEAQEATDRWQQGLDCPLEATASRRPARRGVTPREAGTPRSERKA